MPKPSRTPSTLGWMRNRLRPDAALAVIAALGVAAVVAAVSAGGAKTDRAADTVSWRGLVGGSRAAVPLGQRMIVVLRTPSVAERLKATRFATEAQERAWTSQAYAAQQQVLTQLAVNGLAVKP